MRHGKTGSRYRKYPSGRPRGTPFGRMLREALEWGEIEPIGMEFGTEAYEKATEEEVGQFIEDNKGLMEKLDD